MVLLRHILQLQQRPPSQIDHAICSSGCQPFEGAGGEKGEHAVIWIQRRGKTIQHSCRGSWAGKSMHCLGKITSWW